MITHTSGTTGMPKAVMHSNASLFAATRHLLTLPQAQGTGRILNALPAPHTATVLMVNQALGNRAEFYALSGQQGDVVLEAIQRWRPESVFGFSATWAELARFDLSGYDLSSVRLWFNTGDSTHEPHVRHLVAVGCREVMTRQGVVREPGSHFIDGLGSSEMGHAMFHITHTRDSETFDRCIGRPYKFAEAAVLSLDGRLLADGEVGHLGIKSPSLSPGYWNDSLTTFRSRLNGYYLTGDLVRRDADGRYFHVDRAADSVVGAGRHPPLHRPVRGADPGRLPAGAGLHGGDQPDRRRRGHRRTAGSGPGRRCRAGRADRPSTPGARAGHRRDRAPGERGRRRRGAQGRHRQGAQGGPARTAVRRRDCGVDAMTAVTGPRAAGNSPAGNGGVSITGIGMLTPVGRGIGEVFDAVCTGRSGLASPPVDHPVAGSIEVAGMIAAADGELDPSRIGSGPELNTLDRTIVLAVLTARQALADAGVLVGRDVDPRRIGVIVGGVGGMATLEKQVLQRSIRGRVAVSPYLLTGILPNMPVGQDRDRARHPRLQQLGRYRVCLRRAGHRRRRPADPLRRIGHGAVRGQRGAAVRHLRRDLRQRPRAGPGLGRPGGRQPAVRPPAQRLRALRRRGVAGAGAVRVMPRPAVRRGYADVLGYGSTTDAHHPTIPRPDGTGAADCISMAIGQAGLEPADVGYLNAHGTSTKLGDLAEATAIGLAFGRHQPAVSSTKALTGHMLGTSGVVEAAISALALASGLLPPTYNLDDPDPACELDHICKQPRQAGIRYALSNSFGFGGHNVSLLFGSSDLPTRELPAATEVPAPVSVTEHERGISS